MFCGAKKETNHDGFIPKIPRTFSILQLCVAFSVLIWSFGYPFMQELYELKAKIGIFQSVMGKGDFISRVSEGNPELEAKLKSNNAMFDQLDKREKDRFMNDYAKIEGKFSRDFKSKLWKLYHVVFYDIGGFELAWLFFGIVIPIFLLLRVEGAVACTWLLPIIAGLFCLENAYFGLPRVMTEEEKLFPTEQVLLRNYGDLDWQATSERTSKGMNKGMSKSVDKRTIQKEDLEKAWKNFLAKEWGMGNLGTGEFNFALARAKAIGVDESVSESQLRPSRSYYYFHGKRSSLTLGLYMFWNLLFATVIWMTMKEKAQNITQDINKKKGCPFAYIFGKT